MIQSGDKALLDILRHDDVEEVPKGWYTSAQWAKKWEISQQRAIVYIRRALTKGLMEHRKFRVPLGNRAYPVHHYRVVKK